MFTNKHLGYKMIDVCTRSMAHACTEYRSASAHAISRTGLHLHSTILGDGSERSHLWFPPETVMHAHNCNMRMACTDNSCDNVRARQITLATKCSQSTSFHANIKCTVVATTVLSPYWRKVRLGRIKLTGHRFLWQLSLSKLNTCCSLCVKFDWEMYRLWMKEWTENKSFSYTKAAGTKTLFGPVHLEIWIYCKLFCSGKYLLCLLLQLIRLRWEVLPH
jgi:hypothetical protein